MKRRQQGFTLIEVMVAILLMAVVSLIAWRGLDSVSRADRHLRDSSERTDAVLRALNQLHLDLSSRARTEVREPNLEDDTYQQASALAAIRVRGADDSTFELEVIRRAAEPQQGLQRVRWWWRQGILYRAAAPVRERYPLPAPDEGVAVLAGVDELRTRVWDDEDGWRQLTGSRVSDPPGLELVLVREGERYRRVWADAARTVR